MRRLSGYVLALGGLVQTAVASIRDVLFHRHSER